MIGFVLEAAAARRSRRVILRESKKRWRIVPLMSGLAVIVLAAGVPAAAATVSRSSAGACVDDPSTGTTPWTTPAEAQTSDNAYATAVLTNGATSHTLKCTGFSFSIIPAGATIQGIQVGWEKKSSGNHTVDNSVRIVKSGSIGSTDKSRANEWPTTDTVVTYGGPTDLWGTAWTAADINAGTFGAAISAKSTGGARNPAVDSVTITITYDPCRGVPDGTACDDGNACTIGDICGGGTCHPGAGAPNCDDNNVCTTDSCVPATGCAHIDNTAACDDGNACTTDSCDPATGCVHTNNTAACDDHNACTQTSSCQAGVCIGGNPVVCAAQDQCHAAGVCNVATGVCSNPTVANGSPCSDGDVCTQPDTCQAGVCVAGSPGACGTGEIYVSNYTTNAITIYPRTTNGDVAPSRTIQTGLDHPHTLSVDLLNQELFVSNNLLAADQPAINVYDLNASFPGSDQPKRTIKGAATGLDRPAGLVVDSVHRELYVANDSDAGASITVYPLEANGNAAPLRTLGGALTGIAGPIGMAVDVVHDELFIVNYKVTGDGSITVFPRVASGNVAPIRTIQGDLTGFNRPQGLALDLTHNELVVANSFFSTSSPGNLLVFPRLASGNTAPIRQIAGPSTALCNPIGLVLDLVDDAIVVTNSHAGTNPCSLSVGTYARAASGDAAPIRLIGPGPTSALASPEGVTVRTRVDCSDPLVANGTPCDDGDACTQTDACQGGSCTGAPVVCSGSDLCHAAGVCNPATGVCGSGAPVVCTASDQCHAAGVCNPASGVCSNPAKTNGTTCNDGSACTQADVCTTGVCGGTGVVCNDGNVCTTDMCNPATGCVHTNNTAACDDGNACTVGDTCGNGSCISGPGPNCDDNNPCTTDTCDLATGCRHTNTTAACDDGNACTTGDTCAGGICHAGTALVCNDGNVCTTDSCSPTTGCVFTNNTAACDDGNACTVGDTCGNGSCISGPGPNCDDNNPCTTDACDLATGCRHTNNTAACEDGNACTTGDTCAGGTCHAGAAVDCDDNNACTADQCDSSSGCVHGLADLDESGFSANRVDGLDMVVLADAWNSCPGDPRYNAAANFDRSGAMPNACIDMTDFHLFMNAFGHICPLGVQR